MISIIIPTYNEERTVEATVRQFAGLHVPHEVIVAEGRSTDRTASIAKQCADKVIDLAPGDKPGVSRQRNNGAGAASGEFIVFLDSDDIIPDLNGFFTKALAFFASDPRLVGLSARIEVSPDVRRVSDWIVCEMMNVWFALLNNVFRVGIAAGKFMMVRTPAFRATGGFNENLRAAEDVDIFTRLAHIGRTHTAWGLVVFHSGRRFHQLGAWRTLYRWIKNALSLWTFKKTADGDWETIR